ncbi:MAG: efflux RND transporter periplasmic adaptor subunit [Opitutales bacterium]|nr:efflux RND transporter periplasmic adaptor subunit [Opitutales bacterium]
MNKFVRILLKTGVAFLVLLVILGPIVATKALQIGALIASSKEPFTMPPTSVTTIAVEKTQWNPMIRSVGSVVAVQGVTVTTELPGKVVAIHFESGTNVKEGELLLELDSSTEKAQLASANASADLAEISVKRSRELFEKNAISKAELDTAEARYSEATAAVANLEAVIEKKSIRAPFSGKLGIREVNLGQFVGSGQPVVPLQTLSPVYVDSYVPQQRLANIEVGQSVYIGWSDGASEPMVGEVSAISSVVDEATRNVLVRSKLENAEEILRPGMFVNVDYEQKETRDVLIIPSTAIVYASFGNTVFVATPTEDGEGLTATQQVVKLGESRGDFIEVVEGLAGGETIVSTGAFKLRNGVPIVPQNDKSLEFSQNPKPADA